MNTTDNNDILVLGELMPREVYNEMVRLIPQSDKTYKLSIAPPEFECSICCDYKDGDSVIETDCGHFFHLDCMDRWNEVNNNCPLCRSIQSMCDKSAVAELMNKVKLQIKITILQSWWKEIEGKSLDELRVLSAELQDVVSALTSDSTNSEV